MTKRTSRSARFRVAILGAGAVAETHVHVLAGVPDVDLVAICDINPIKAEIFRQKRKIPVAYSRLAMMLSEVRPDTVHLAVPPVAHASAAVTCLDANAHVFLEKPFCLSSSECVQIADAAARSGLRVGVNHNMVFHPACVSALDSFRSGRLGAVEHVTVGFNFPMPELARGHYDHWLFQRSENIAFELGVHPLSLVQQFCGRVLEAQTVCSAEKQLPSGETFYPTFPF